MTGDTVWNDPLARQPVWETYTGNAAGSCGADIGITTVSVPVLSSAPLRAWIEKSATVKAVNADTVLVTCTATDTVVVYTVDPKRWVVIGVKETQTIGPYVYFQYIGGHSWTQVQGMWALSRVFLNGDTTLAHGGQEFTNIVLNDSLPDSLFTLGVRGHTARMPAVAGASPARSVRGRLAILLSDDRAKPASAVVTDLRGRRTRARAAGPCIADIRP